MRKVVLLLIVTFLWAGVDRSLPYPEVESITAKEVARQVHFVNHQLYLKNQIVKKVKRKSIVIVRRAPGRKPYILQVERYLNNDFDDGVIKSKDMVIFVSGKMKGTGVLATEYIDDDRSMEMLLWLPALRKVRRIGEPSKNMAYSEADVAFMEESKLRRIGDDVYILMGTKSMTFEQATMQFPKGKRNRLLNDFPQKADAVQADVYMLKATPKEDAWYDYRVDYVDRRHFTVYRTNYYQDDEVVKTIERHWVKVEGVDDPRAYMWTYWYAIDPETHFETVNYIPSHIIKSDQDIKASFWSPRTLQKLKK